MSGTFPGLRAVRFSDGDEFALLVDRDGLPLDAALLYTLSVVRNRHRAYNTPLQTLRSIRFLYCWSTFEGINLVARITSGQLLTISETRALEGACSRRITEFRSAGDATGEAALPPRRLEAIRSSRRAGLPEAFRRLQAALLKQAGGERGMVDVLARVLSHDEALVLSAVERALEAGAPTKMHVVNILHRLLARKVETLPPVAAWEIQSRLKNGRVRSARSRKLLEVKNHFHQVKLEASWKIKATSTPSRRCRAPRQGGHSSSRCAPCG